MRNKRLFRSLIPERAHPPLGKLKYQTSAINIILKLPSIASDRDRDSLECTMRPSQSGSVSKLPCSFETHRREIFFIPTPLERASVKPSRLSVRGALFTWKRVHVTLRFSRGKKKEHRGDAGLHEPATTRARVCVCRPAFLRVSALVRSALRPTHTCARARARVATAAAASSIHAYTRSQTDSRLESNILK